MLLAALLAVIIRTMLDCCMHILHWGHNQANVNLLLSLCLTRLIRLLVNMVEDLVEKVQPACSAYTNSRALSHMGS